MCSTGLHGPPVAPHVEQGNLPGEIVMVIQNANNVVPLLVSAGPLGPPVLHLVDEVRGPGAVVMEKSK